MNPSERDRLRSIRTFPSLVKYLRDDLDWPIESDNFDDLTFEYEPEELGLDARTAVKIKEIKQLRPLTTNQPWGIFFINFEPKRLPVVVLRRILRSLVVKKRQSAHKAKQATWQLHDLLFISSYGESDHRDISFAHFAEDPNESDLPALRVLGWDDEDTVLHLEHTHKTLADKLRWPDDADNLETWRQKWSSAFTIRHREVITTSKDMAVRLAELATAIRKRVNRVLAFESEKGPLRKMMAAFREALIHDLSDDDFADMYAQTITYGLLTARVSRPAGLVADNVTDMVPITNPFLRDLLSTFLTVGGRKGKIDFDELGVNEVVEALRLANMEAVLRDFGDRNPQEDPVVHFYELFLKEYDPKKRMQRGVFYTPRPVVSYIVRSVHELLHNEFGLEDGLADTTTWGEMIKHHKDLKIPDGMKKDDAFVQILDPATGTATFLVEVIDVIHKTMVAKWKKQGDTEMFDIPKLWNEYVPKHLLPRLHGYELMMAPYAIAHMKIGLKLYETGYKFGSNERARVYLTNALEPPQDFSDRLAFDAPALAHEAQAVNEIKRHKRLTVIIGNPPYSPSISEPPWLMTLLEDWKRGLNETKIDLNREEWKFLRLGQHLCASSNLGIVGFIINRDFLDGIAKRKMREHMQSTFPLRVIVDLNGDVKGNIVDQNVFEITQGVCVAMLCGSNHQIHSFVSLVGSRESKYKLLTDKRALDGQLQQFQPIPPYFRWLPGGSDTVAGLEAEYHAGIPINTVFNVYSSGIQTKRDAFCVHWSKNEIWRTIQKFDELTTECARLEFNLGEDGRDWSVKLAKKDIRISGPSKEFITPILYRPFDIRFTYWTGRTKGFLAYPRRDVMQHVLTLSNKAMIFNRQIVGDKVSHFGVSRIPICHGTFYLGNKGQDYLAPLYIRQDETLAKYSSKWLPNLTREFVAAINLRLGQYAEQFEPEQIFNYIYAVFHSPTYRTRYTEFLKIDFPRLPLTSSLDLFRSLAKLGDELVALHLMESPKLDNHITKWIGVGIPVIERVAWCEKTVWIDAPACRKGAKQQPGTQGFHVVPEEVWNFHVGGYQVCEKWLKDRKGRTLSKDDIEHYHKIVVALHETIRLMAEIDKVIDQHGGWPGAFSTDKNNLKT